VSNAIEQKSVKTVGSLARIEPTCPATSFSAPFYLLLSPSLSLSLFLEHITFIATNRLSIDTILWLIFCFCSERHFGRQIRSTWSLDPCSLYLHLHHHLHLHHRRLRFLFLFHFSLRTSHVTSCDLLHITRTVPEQPARLPSFPPPQHLLPHLLPHLPHLLPDHDTTRAIANLFTFKAQVFSFVFCVLTSSN
jgi:hypothetical protein